MKAFPSRSLMFAAFYCAAGTIGVAQALPQGRPAPRGRAEGGPPAATGTYSKVSGTILQLNYDPDAEVEGFLLSNKTLVHFPKRVAPQIASTVHTGDSVDITGYSRTAATGFQCVEAESIQDRTSGKEFRMPANGAAAPFSGSGRIQQLNYGPDGNINGIILDNGTLATMPAFGSNNPSSVRVGETVGYSGYARSTFGGRTVVAVQTITIHGQALALGSAGPLRAPLPPTPPPAPESRTEQPPAPPPPPQD